MKVILLCDVKGTGKKDDVLNVSDGFARNYLFPRKWAVEATPGAVKEIERKRANEERLERERREAAQKLADSLRGKVITLKVKCGSQGRLLRQHHQPGNRRRAQGTARRGRGQAQDRVRAHPPGGRCRHHRLALLRRDHPHEGFRHRRLRRPRHDAVSLRAA